MRRYAVTGTIDVVLFYNTEVAKTERNYHKVASGWQADLICKDFSGRGTGKHDPCLDYGKMVF